VAPRVLGTTLRAIGRGLGVGTFGLAQASAANPANPANPTANASVTSALVPNAVRRKVGGGTNGVTAFLRGRINQALKPWLYLIEYMDKILNTRGIRDVCAFTAAKSGLGSDRRGPFARSPDPL
jgi:hypothetical protein